MSVSLVSHLFLESAEPRRPGRKLLGARAEGKPGSCRGFVASPAPGAASCARSPGPPPRPAPAPLRPGPRPILPVSELPAPTPVRPSPAPRPPAPQRCSGPAPRASRRPPAVCRSGLARAWRRSRSRHAALGGRVKEARRARGGARDPRSARGWASGTPDLPVGQGSRWRAALLCFRSLLFRRCELRPPRRLVRA